MPEGNSTDTDHTLQANAYKTNDSTTSRFSCHSVDPVVKTFDLGFFPYRIVVHLRHSVRDDKGRMQNIALAKMVHRLRIAVRKASSCSSFTARWLQQSAARAVPSYERLLDAVCWMKHNEIATEASLTEEEVPKKQETLEEVEPFGCLST